MDCLLGHGHRFSLLWLESHCHEAQGMEFPLESFFITLWAATMYLTMILGETVIRPTTGLQTEVYLGRYL